MPGNIYLSRPSSPLIQLNLRIIFDFFLTYRATMPPRSHHGKPLPRLLTPATPMARRRSDSEHSNVERQPVAATTETPQQAKAMPPVTDDPLETKMKSQWNNAVLRNSKESVEYAKVAVLVVKWALHLDNLKRLEEASPTPRKLTVIPQLTPV